MNPEFAVFLLMNNYFHDVATAMLLACAAALRVLERADAIAGGRTATDYAELLRRGVLRLAWFSAAWIAVSGAVRIATIPEFEWRNFAEKGLLSGLITKYIIALAMAAAGAALLARFARNRRAGAKI